MAEFYISQGYIKRSQDWRVGLVKKENLSTIVSTETATDPMETLDSRWQRVVERRSFLNDIGMAGAALSVGTLLATEGRAENKSSNSRLSPGDVARDVRMA